jgi:hypothetical protein
MLTKIIGDPIAELDFVEACGKYSLSSFFVVHRSLNPKNWQ